MTDPVKSSGVNIREWVRDRILFLAVAIFVIGAAAYISAGQLFDSHSIWLHPVREFALLISLIGVISLGYEVFLRELTFNEYKEALEEIVNPDAVRLGIHGIYKNRSELAQATSFEALFKNVKEEVFIGGSSLLSISTASRDLIKEKALSGIKIRLLLMDPDSPVVELITKQGGGKYTFMNEIKTSLLLLQKLYDEIEHDSPPGNKGQLIVHSYDEIPSHSFISIDPELPSGVIVADIGPYLGRSTPRPSMMVINKKKGMFYYWKEMNDLMWESSRVVDMEEADPLTSQIKTLVMGSGINTDYYNTQEETWVKSSICQMGNGWRGIKGSQWVWIRDTVLLEEAKTGSQHKFRVQFDLPIDSAKSIHRAEILLRSDDTCHITVNSVSLKQEYGGAEYPDPFLIDIDQFIHEGENTITFELISYARPDAKEPSDSPTGLIYRLHLEYS
ncbi:MAG: hypothetical protein HOL15_05545 [Nitrospinaceae bacterium]|nr:hypothetical protein [Nitrospina sp.]MBT5376254.1 hypothetical protein [Nitrospinaceae bacterium]MBT5868065.1 hypothetical protein [Nitrospinaceae bacterium]MBT6345557.1 hypothetical protein [Nitrospina sp.]